MNPVRSRVPLEIIKCMKFNKYINIDDMQKLR